MGEAWRGVAKMSIANPWWGSHPNEEGRVSYSRRHCFKDRGIATLGRHQPSNTITSLRAYIVSVVGHPYLATLLPLWLTIPSYPFTTPAILALLARGGFGLVPSGSSGTDQTEQELRNLNGAGADPTEQELGNSNGARADPTEQELGNLNGTGADPTEQELGNLNGVGADLTEQELGNLNGVGADPTEQELGNSNGARAREFEFRILPRG
ncbi:hypothetical protein GW17_00045683 [Ensete ventricosum]|nr:hypothetical protein GW17_00045683 [Ensete ventricosum]